MALARPGILWGRSRAIKPRLINEAPVSHKFKLYSFSKLSSLHYHRLPTSLRFSTALHHFTFINLPFNLWYKTNVSKSKALPAITLSCYLLLTRISLPLLSLWMTKISTGRNHYAVLTHIYLSRTSFSSVQVSSRTFVFKLPSFVEDSWSCQNSVCFSLSLMRAISFLSLHLALVIVEPLSTNGSVSLLSAHAVLFLSLRSALVIVEALSTNEAMPLSTTRLFSTSLALSHFAIQCLPPQPSDYWSRRLAVSQALCQMLCRRVPRTTKSGLS